MAYYDGLHKLNKQVGSITTNVLEVGFLLEQISVFWRTAINIAYAFFQCPSKSFFYSLKINCKTYICSFVLGFC